MNQHDFDLIVSETVSSIQRLLVAKGAEYAGSEDRLANFKRGSALTGAHPLQVLLVYLSKHYDAVSTYVRTVAAGGQPTLSEPIEGRFDDLINYAILAKALIADLNTQRGPVHGAVPPMVAGRDGKPYDGGLRRVVGNVSVSSADAVAQCASNNESGTRDDGAVHCVVAGEGIRTEAAVQQAPRPVVAMKAGGFRCQSCKHGTMPADHSPCFTCVGGTAYAQ